MNPKIADHQQLSNYIWWHIGILGNPLSYAAIQITEIIERFNNRILPYRPHPGIQNEKEINGLIDRGLIYLNDIGNILIIHNKKIIGEILNITHPMFTGR